MAGLFAWAADVVGHGGDSNEDDDSIPIIFNPEQQKYAGELDAKAASLSRAIQDLRLRLPPPDISQRLPHLHAHSLASNAALALQQNAHSATRHQIQQREITLQEENANFENAISDCENRLQEKLREANDLQRRLEEMDSTEENLRAELKNAESISQSKDYDKVAAEVQKDDEAHLKSTESALHEKLENKKKELSAMEEAVRTLERKWEELQENALKRPSPTQREKILDKQLHSLIEQLETKQAQAERLVSEIHSKEIELERLNGLARKLEMSNADMNPGYPARNRFVRSGSGKGSTSTDNLADVNLKPPFYISGRTEAQQRLMFLRSSFVLHILALHILVFIKISF
uniref:Uncharacterized protein n=1 Tax=Kalanchoe fedtschenkoi TaxID=63787 RepID=A0A7N0UWD1_KALFE